MTALPAFRSRNYRLFFAGQLISLIGTWMQQIAMTWLTYRLTDSTVMLGLVSFASQIPILLFGPLAGVWNDRTNRHRLMILTQFLALLQAVMLFVLTLTGTANPPLLVMLAFMLGCINAVDMPTRQAFVAQLVEHRNDLPNAIGLNSFLMNSARFIGPALAGLIVATAGEAICFLINALSYLAVLLALLAMRLAPQAPGHGLSTWLALKAGFGYARTHPRIRVTLLLVACFSFFITPYAVMMPVFARDLFSGNAETYGYLIGSAGLGSLCAAVFLAYRGGRHAGTGLDRIVARAAISGGTALACFTLAPSLPATFPWLAILGFSVVITAAGSNTLVQIDVEEAFRGRVMAIFSTAFLGIAPLGSLSVGWIGAQFGVRPTLFGCGVVALLAGAAYRRRIAG